MKKILFILIAVFLSNCTYSQQLMLMTSKKETSPYHTLSANRAYSAIISTDLQKEELIPKTKELFILEGLADAADLATAVYDENLSEYKIRFGYYHGQYKMKGAMGAPYVAPAIKLYFDAIFAFNSEGQIKITFTNFKSYVLVAVNEDGVMNKWREKDTYGAPTLAADLPVYEETNTIIMTQTGIGKALLFANGGADMVNSATRGEFRKGLAEQFSMYEKSCNEGSCVWISDETIASYEMKGVMGWEKLLNTFMAAQLVIGFDTQRWENYFEQNFNYFFKEIAELVSGNIDKVALDGNIKYEISDGKLLPVDTKERKKWEKEGIEF